MPTNKSISNAAEEIGCEPAVIKAVIAVESSGRGFINGRMIIRYEGHIFHRMTKGRFSISHYWLSYPSWTNKYNGNQNHEWKRFNNAFALDPTGAMMSISMGMFQIMGFNHGMCNYKTVQEMFAAQSTDEDEQLEAFVTYILNSGLDDELKNKQWAKFAYRYNGAQYWKNKYDTKLEAAYAKFKK